MDHHAACRSVGRSFWFDSDGLRTRSRCASSGPPCALVTPRSTRGGPRGRLVGGTGRPLYTLGSTLRAPGAGKPGALVARSASRQAFGEPTGLPRQSSGDEGMRTAARLAIASAVVGVALLATGRQAATEQPAGTLSVSVGYATSVNELRRWDAAVDRMIRGGELVVASRRTDGALVGRTHERLVQQVAGIPVYGGGMSRQLDRGVTVSLLGRCIETSMWRRRRGCRPTRPPGTSPGQPARRPPLLRGWSSCRGPTARTRSRGSAVPDATHRMRPAARSARSFWLPDSDGVTDPARGLRELGASAGGPPTGDDGAALRARDASVDEAGSSGGPRGRLVGRGRHEPGHRAAALYSAPIRQSAADLAPDTAVQRAV